MTCVIVDDERLARTELRTLLAVHPEVRIVGEASNVASALQVIGEQRPTLVFLDIQMPGGTGFDLVAQLSPPLPQIVFTTAHNQHALRAFEVNALDYLLKPVAASRLKQALARVSAPREVPTKASMDHEPPLRVTDRVFLRSEDRAWLIPVADIRLLESEGNYTRVRFEKERPLIHRTLGALEKRLPRESFLRANRTQIVNLLSVKTVLPWFSGTLKVVLSGGEEVEFSRRQAHQFRGLKEL
jgi:two-component system LytT family response regulator